jgi:predicted hydrocarbon binding protein
MSSRGLKQVPPANDAIDVSGHVIGSILRAVLQAIQETSGPQYPNILRAAKLNRFIDALPEEGIHPVATREEFERLYSAVYQMLGESLTRLFLRNYGQRMAVQLLANPEMQQRIAHAATLAPAQRLEAFVHGYAEYSARVWAAIRITQDEQAWYLELEYCPNCAGIHGATAPICQSPVVVFGTLAKAAVGRSVRITELTCAAAGDAHCKFALYK